MQMIEHVFVSEKQIREGHRGPGYVTALNNVDGTFRSIGVLRDNDPINLAKVELSYPYKESKETDLRTSAVSTIDKNQPTLSLLQ